MSYDTDAKLGLALIGCGLIAIIAKIAFIAMIVYGIYYFIFHFMPGMLA